MSSIALNTSPVPPEYIPAYAPKAAAGPAQTSGQPADEVRLGSAALREIALTGRIATNAAAGNLTSDQAQQLYGQVSSIHSQISADRLAGGGILSPAETEAIQQLQNQLSGMIYTDAHNGAAPPSSPDETRAGAREAVQAGRIALNEKAGNLTGDQAKQLGSQLGAIQRQIKTDEQANGGTLSSTDAQSINRLQNQLSRDIYQAAHPGSTPAQLSAT